MIVKIILTIVCLVILVLFWYSAIMAKWVKFLSEEIKKQVAKIEKDMLYGEKRTKDNKNDKQNV